MTKGLGDRDKLPGKNIDKLTVYYGLVKSSTENLQKVRKMQNMDNILSLQLNRSKPKLQQMPERQWRS